MSCDIGLVIAHFIHYANNDSHARNSRRERTPLVPSRLEYTKCGSMTRFVAHGRVQTALTFLDLDLGNLARTQFIV